MGWKATNFATPHCYCASLNPERFSIVKQSLLDGEELIKLREVTEERCRIGLPVCSLVTPHPCSLPVVWTTVSGIFRPILPSSAISRHNDFSLLLQRKPRYVA